MSSSHNSQEVLQVSGFQNDKRSLNGTYHKSTSTNHGRGLFVKTLNNKPVNDTEPSGVSKIYYWDDRDGPDLQGWWCSPVVGGEEVWARNISDARTPPMKNWLVPWHSKIPDPLILMQLTTNNWINQFQTNQTLLNPNNGPYQKGQQNHKGQNFYNTMSTKGKCSKVNNADSMFLNGGPGSGFPENHIITPTLQNNLESSVIFLESCVKQLSNSKNLTDRTNLNNANSNSIFKKEISIAQQCLSATRIKIENACRQGRNGMIQNGPISMSIIGTQDSIIPDDVSKDWFARIQIAEAQITVAEKTRQSIVKDNLDDIHTSFHSKSEQLLKNITDLMSVLNRKITKEERSEICDKASNLDTEDKDTANKVKATIKPFFSLIHRIGSAFSDCRTYLTLCRDTLNVGALPSNTIVGTPQDSQAVAPQLVQPDSNTDFSIEDREKMKKISPCIGEVAKQMRELWADYIDLKEKFVIARGHCKGVIVMNRIEED